MALQVTEVWRGGYVRSTINGALVTTAVLTGAVSSGGQLRDPDGRLVVRYV